MIVILIHLVSNSLKPQRQISIGNLFSSTKYIVRIEAYNIAGVASDEFAFTTLSRNGGKYYCIMFSNVKSMLLITIVKIKNTYHQFTTI